MERPWNNPFFPLTQYPTILTILKKDNFCFSLPSSACLPREFLAFPANVPLENLYLLAPNSISFLFQGPNKERDKLSFATSYDHWRDLGRGIDLGPRRERRGEEGKPKSRHAIFNSREEGHEGKPKINP